MEKTLTFHIMVCYFHNMKVENHSNNIDERVKKYRSTTSGDIKPARVSGSQSVYRAIAILSGVARNNATGITATKLANELELTLATTHRLLRVLASEGMLTFDPYSKKYHLGLELYTLGMEARHFGLRNLLATPMERIREVTRETVFLVVRSGADALCLERLDGDFPIRKLTLTVGSRRPLGVGAGSLALLAAESDEVVEQVLRHNDKLYKDYAGFTLEKIREAIALTRKRRASFNDGRLANEVRAVGMAFGPLGEPPYAAVSIATSQARMEEQERTKFQALLKSEIGELDWNLIRDTS